MLVAPSYSTTTVRITHTRVGIVDPPEHPAVPRGHVTLLNLGVIDPVDQRPDGPTAEESATRL